MSLMLGKLMRSNQEARLIMMKIPNGSYVAALFK